MTEDQKQDLFIELDLYESREQEAIFAEYREKYYGNYTREGLLEFLKKRIEIEGYWKKVGLA